LSRGHTSSLPSTRPQPRSRCITAQLSRCTCEDQQKPRWFTAGRASRQSSESRQLNRLLHAASSLTPPFGDPLHSKLAKHTLAGSWCQGYFHSFFTLPHPFRNQPRCVDRRMNPG
jgi:hypothetical protein